jgi:hypothetical protein
MGAFASRPVVDGWGGVSARMQSRAVSEKAWSAEEESRVRIDMSPDEWTGTMRKINEILARHQRAAGYEEPLRQFILQMNDTMGRERGITFQYLIAQEELDPTQRREYVVAFVTKKLEEKELEEQEQAVVAQGAIVEVPAVPLLQPQPTVHDALQEIRNLRAELSQMKQEMGQLKNAASPPPQNAEPGEIQVEGVPQAAPMPADAR